MPRRRTRRKMTAKQRKYFAPRRTRTRTVVKTMPRRRRSYGRVRRSRGGRRGLGGILSGKIGNIVAGLAAGVAASTLSGKIPYSNPLAFGGVGYFMGNETLLTMAGLQLSSAIPNPLATGTASPAGYI